LEANHSFRFAGKIANANIISLATLHTATHYSVALIAQREHLICVPSEASLISSQNKSKTSRQRGGSAERERANMAIFDGDWAASSLTQSEREQRSL